MYTSINDYMYIGVNEYKYTGINVYMLLARRIRVDAYLFLRLVLFLLCNHKTFSIMNISGFSHIVVEKEV